MQLIISKFKEIIKQTNDMIEAEKEIKRYTEALITDCLGAVFEEIDGVIEEEKILEGWKRVRQDNRTIHFSFGAVPFSRTLMQAPNQDTSYYPLDQFLHLRPYQRYSSLVEVKTAELASEADYRTTARTLQEWTNVTMSHSSVGKIVRLVGEAQSKEDAAMIQELEEADGLPAAEKIDHLFAEADGVYVRSTKKKKSIEVKHGITYEGWARNGRRVSLEGVHVYMTTKDVDSFWNHVQAGSAHLYDLRQTQVVSNSDGGLGYTAERFKSAFSQSEKPVINQLDAYHIQQGLNRAFGVKHEFKPSVKKAIEQKDEDAFIRWMDTYESMLENEKKIERVQKFKQYILNNWSRIQDWRNEVEDTPDNARSLGAMESHQRHVTFRMKKRGMHWSDDGAESMVKVKQGMINGTLRGVYLKHQRRSAREHRRVKQTVRMSAYLKQPTRPAIGVKQGSISLYTSHSSAGGKLRKIFR